MRVAGVLWRGLLLLGIFAGVGLWASHALIAHAVARGSPEYAVRLGGEMGGLFAGGLAATVAGIALLLAGRGGGSGSEPDRSRPDGSGPDR